MMGNLRLESIGNLLKKSGDELYEAIGILGGKLTVDEYIVRADMYIEYKYFEEAEKSLREGLANYPGDRELQEALERIRRA